MTGPLATLVALAVVSAVLPVQVAITLLMLRSDGGRARAAAWIAGMALVRLAQYAVLGGVLDAAISDEALAGPSPVEGALLLVVAVLLLVSAVRKVTDQPDEDAVPPRWTSTAGSLPVGRALLAGAGLVGLSPKLWAITLGAIGAIAEAGLSGAAGWGAFLAWMLAAQSLHVVALLAAVLAPARTALILGRAVDALEQHSRPVMVALGLVFGLWFLLKALAAFGVLG